MWARGLFNEPRHGWVHKTVLRLISASRAHILQVRQEATVCEKRIIASEMMVGVWKESSHEIV